MPRRKPTAEPTPASTLPLGLCTVDGLEGPLARIELPAGGTQDVLLSLLPAGVKEGDVLRVDASGTVIDRIETQRRRDVAQAQLDALNAALPSGDLDL
jgi:Protein of unknown function (DUF3006)